MLRSMLSSCFKAALQPLVPHIFTLCTSFFPCRYGMSARLGQVSLDYEDDGRSISSETRALVEEEVKALVQVRGQGWGK